MKNAQNFVLHHRYIFETQFKCKSSKEVATVKWLFEVNPIVTLVVKNIFGQKFSSK